MCFSIPGKVKSIKNNNFFIDYQGNLQRVGKSLVKVKKGEWVLVQNGVIVRKISPKNAKEILELIS